MMLRQQASTNATTTCSIMNMIERRNCSAHDRYILRSSRVLVPCRAETVPPPTHNSADRFSEPAAVAHMDDGKSAPPAYAAGTSSAEAPRKAKGRGDGLPLLLRSGADGFRRCLAVIDFVLRVAAMGPTLAAAISTGTADETLSVFTHFFQFHARFDDFPAFTFFMVANAIAAGYLALSLPFSAVGILRPEAAGARRPLLLLLLLVCDLVATLLLTAAGAAAAAVVYVAHWGNLRANWAPICMQFHGFCKRTSGAVVASFLAVLVFLVLILMAAGATRRR